MWGTHVRAAESTQWGNWSKALGFGASSPSLGLSAPSIAWVLALTSWPHGSGGHTGCYGHLQGLHSHHPVCHGAWEAPDGWEGSGVSSVDGLPVAGSGEPRAWDSL